MKRKRLFCFFLLLLAAFSVKAQEVITVKTFKELTADIAARTNRRYDGNDNPCALLKILYPKEGATFEGYGITGDAEFKNGEYWVYMSGNAKRIKIHLPDTPTIELEFSDYGISSVQGNTTYSVEFVFPKTGGKLPFKFYAEAGFVAGGMMGPELSLGAYLGGFNLEANAMLPLASADLNWNHAYNPSVVCTYKPVFSVGGRLGYGISIGEKLRITPQVGMMFLKTSEKHDGNPGVFAKGAYSSSLAIDVKLQYFIAKNISIALAPEYDMTLMKSNGFKMLSDASSKIKKWNNGVGGKLAISFEF